MMLAPSANRVYAGESARLSAAELELTADFASQVGPTTLSGVDYLGFEMDGFGEERLQVLARQSAALALFEQQGVLLRPVQLPEAYGLDDDLVTIPKYPGKTNEQFTQLLMNVTLASIDTTLNPKAAQGPLAILDPLCGRGTTLMVAWMLGHNGYGVEGDEKSVEQMAAYLKTWLRRKRLKHTADTGFAGAYPSVIITALTCIAVFVVAGAVALVLSRREALGRSGEPSPRPVG